MPELNSGNFQRPKQLPQGALLTFETDGRIRPGGELPIGHAIPVTTKKPKEAGRGVGVPLRLLFEVNIGIFQRP